MENNPKVSLETQVAAYAITGTLPSAEGLHCPIDGNPLHLAVIAGGSLPMTFQFICADHACNFQVSATESLPDAVKKRGTKTYAFIIVAPPNGNVAATWPKYQPLFD